MYSQIIQLVGSCLVLGAFVAAQGNRMSTSSFGFLFPNAVGSAILAVLAAWHLQYGFLLLEGVWAAVSTLGLIRELKGRRRAGTAPC